MTHPPQRSRIEMGAFFTLFTMFVTWLGLQRKTPDAVEGQLTERKAGRPPLLFKIFRDTPLCALAGLTGFWRQKVRERESSR